MQVVVQVQISDCASAITALQLNHWNPWWPVFNCSHLSSLFQFILFYFFYIFHYLKIMWPYRINATLNITIMPPQNVL